MNKINFYSRVPKKYVDHLYNDFTYITGRLRVAISNNNIKCAFIAFDDGKIIGWGAVYLDDGFPYEITDNKDYHIGIFVAPEARHFGLGARLRAKCILWSARKKKLCMWYNMKKDFQYTLIAPNEVSFYQLRVAKIVAKDMGMTKEDLCQMI